jgi:hypothetical protein
MTLGPPRGLFLRLSGPACKSLGKAHRFVCFLAIFALNSPVLTAPYISTACSVLPVYYETSSSAKKALAHAAHACKFMYADG